MFSKYHVYKNFIKSLLLQQKDIIKQTLLFIRVKKFRAAWYWFTMRYIVSLCDNINNSRKSSYKKDGYSLNADGFAPLPQLTKNLTHKIKNYFLNTQGYSRDLNSEFMKIAEMNTH